MSGRIPKYGAHFRLESLPYSPDLANRAYVLKRDPAWSIRSGKTSETWRIYWHFTEHLVTPAGKPLPTLGMAMNHLLEGIDRGFYSTAEPGKAPSAGPEVVHVTAAGTAGEYAGGVWIAEAASDRNECIGVFARPAKAREACQDIAEAYFGHGRTPALKWLGDDEFASASHHDPGTGNVLFMVTRREVKK